MRPSISVQTILLAAGIVASGCSSTSVSSGPGTGNNSVGGSAATGGSKSAGGSVAVGGSAQIGSTASAAGSQSTGGVVTTGGAVSTTTGGKAAGGTSTTGGSTPAGGSVAVGGSTSAVGGITATGGKAAGGSTATGGKAAGGSTATGGKAAGGSTSVAGSTAPGGSTATGGSATGGSTGSSSEDLGKDCAKTITVPALSALKANSKLPDPFAFMDGSKVTSKADWPCRRKEISLLAQEFIYGKKPPPPESVTATFSGGKLSITVANGGKSIQFSVNISGAGSSPTPAIFSIGATVPSGYATIDYASVGETIAKSNGSQGRITPSGLFYTLYPDYKSTGSLMAWAWGASRVIDALEKTTGHNIDVKHLSALGCSRNGKEAGIMALFDDRFALVAAQSPGSGLSSAWRVAQAQTSSVQTASQIYGEDTWMGENFTNFGNSNVNKLPVDQHSVIALAWPRPVIIMEGTNDSWNCPVCEYTTMKYAQLVFEALGSKDYIGFPQPNHTHCQQAGTFAIDYYNAFLNRFMKGQSVSTADKFTENFTFDSAKWQDGAIPTLN